MSFDDSQNNVIYSENGNYKVTAYGEVVFGNDETQYPLSDGVIEVGNDGRPTEPVLVLSSRGGNKIGAIQNVRSINVTHPLSEVAELSFDVYKEINGEYYKDWDKIKDFKFIQMPHDNNWFEAKVTIDEENDIVKHVTCVHANEAELGQLNLYEVEINTDADIERDDYVETFFYNEEDPKASLLHRILKDKAPHYQIYHVDDSLKGLWRSFSFNGVSIQDALNQVAEEVGCLFVYGEWSENDGKYHRTISAYDLEDYCNHCGKRGNYTEHICTNCGSDNIKYGYGEDTGIFISRENLATSINYESNTDDVKNCFRLVAGDDIMTAAIKSCNPSMSQYMWYFSEDMLEDMSDELRSKITEYQNKVGEYQTSKPIEIDESYIDNYNALVEKYNAYNEDLVEIDYPITGTTKLTEAYYNAVNLYGFIKSELMPSSEKVESTTALEQLEILQADGNMSEVGISNASGTIPYTSANSAIQSYAKVYIDTSRYKVTVFTNDIVGTEWTGTITIQSYTDDEDTASDTFTITLFDSTDNTKYTDWVHQSVQKAMANREVTDLSVTNLFKKDESVESFKEKIKSYSLDYLDIMNDMATSAITVMTEQGIANEDSLDTDVYTQLYKPYLDKSRAIQAEIGIKEEELSKLQRPVDEDGNTDPRYPELGLIDVIVSKQNELSKLLDIQTYIGDDLWTELSFYRRENEYQNANYISDGLNDSEIIEQAQRFIESATKEIIKSSTLQHSISAPLIDFLIMPEFMKLQKKFKTGNWIRLMVDGKVYKLRLTNWTVDFDNIEDLDVEFSDVIRVGNTVSDIASILSKSRSMATTYDYTAKQANKGKDANDTIKVYKDYGLDFRKIKAITSKGNTNIVYDDDGILLKRVDGTETLPEQARIYNNGIYITKDAWETVSTGLGHYSYVDPETGQTVETYGIIADTVIGKLILGENLKIYSESGKFEIGDDGLVITAKPNDDNSGLFTIQKDTGELDEDDNPIIEKYIYVDEDGHVNISGNSVIIRGTTGSDTYSLDDARKVATNYLSADTSGIMIADLRNGEQSPSSQSLTGRNVFINNEGVDIRNGTESLANFSDTVRIGKIVYDRPYATVDNHGMNILISRGQITNKLISLGALYGGNMNENMGHRIDRNFTYTLLNEPTTGSNISLTLVYHTVNPSPTIINCFTQGVATSRTSTTAPSVILDYVDIDGTSYPCGYLDYDGDRTFTYVANNPITISVPTGEIVDDEEEYQDVEVYWTSFLTPTVFYSTGDTTSGGYITNGTRTYNTPIGGNTLTNGTELIASSRDQIVVGRYNESDGGDENAIIVGDGNSGQRHNSFTVGRGGNVFAAGDLDVTGNITQGGTAVSLYGHSHNASAITMGTLPIERGGSGNNKTFSTTTISNVCTAASGWSVTQAQYCSWGKVATIHIVCKKNSTAASDGYQTICTLLEGKRPKFSSPALKGWHDGAIVNTDGTIQFSDSVAANEDVQIRATYVLA